MRSWSFKFNNEAECDKAGAAFMEMFKDTEDYKKRKIVLGRVKDKDDSFKIFLSIDDDVPGSFIISVSNAFEKNLKNVFCVVKADCKDINVELPTNCAINSWYDEEPAKKETK